jgi:environmental stress-induced protein Ves
MMQAGGVSTERFPLDVHVIEAAQRRTMPWKNGLGTTTEIAIDPPGADLADRFRWRLSIASVQSSGPFSTFPGYERTIMLIEGRGMELVVGSNSPRRFDRPFEPFLFSGDAPAECRLIDGPIRDFNLMVDRSVLRSRTEVWHLDSMPRPIDLSPAGWIIHCFAGQIDLQVGAARRSHRLSTDATAVLRRGQSGGDDLQAEVIARDRSLVAAIALTAHGETVLD